MKKKLVLFKRIEVDIEAERTRCNDGRYNKRQTKSLNILLDLFEKGEWQKCLDHIKNKKSFPYNKKEEYDEKEHIGIEVGKVIKDTAYYNYYTQPNLLDQAKECLTKQRKKL